MTVNLNDIKLSPNLAEGLPMSGPKVKISFWSSSSWIALPILNDIVVSPVNPSLYLLGDPF